MMVTGTLVGAAAFILGWACRAAWGPLFGKSYEEDVEEGNDGDG